MKHFSVNFIHLCSCFMYNPLRNYIYEKQLLYVVNKSIFLLQLKNYEVTEKYIQITHVKHRSRPKKNTI